MITQVFESLDSLECDDDLEAIIKMWADLTDAQRCQLVKMVRRAIQENG